MTTRGGALSFLVSLVRLEEEHCEWGKGDGERMAEALVRHRRCHRAAEVAEPAAAVERGVAIQQLAPAAAAGNAEPVVVARYRREIADHGDRRIVLTALANEGEHALLPVAALDPAETLDREILFVQRLFALVDPVQVRNPALHAFVALIHAEHMPLEARLVRPFAPLAELAAHEEQLLAGVR